MDRVTREACRRAARLLDEADCLVIGAGAGMGVDAGLPDFRGAQGFWSAYPALGREGLAFTDIANPQAFRDRPRVAWGFYGHRLALYRRTPPHAGYQVLRAMGERCAGGAFVFTSNVDGHFQRAGWVPERVIEAHGSIQRLQCVGPCQATTWTADGLEPRVDEARCEWLGPLPTCPECGELARPNILMFGDFAWVDGAEHDRTERLVEWLRTHRRPVALELGAGNAVPTVRSFCRALRTPLIRINPDYISTTVSETVDIASGALAALQAIAAELAVPLGDLGVFRTETNT